MSSAASIGLRSSAPLLFLAGVTLVSARASAQSGSACPEPRLRVEGILTARWLEPVVELCESLASMHDVDPSAQLRVVGAGDDVIVEVTLGDGRSTLRRVHSTADLPLTVEALVTVPPPLPVAEPVPQHVDAPRPFPPVSLYYQRPTHRLHLEMGAGALGRVAGAPTYLSIGISAYAGVRSGPWLLALLARYDGFQTVVRDRPRQFEMTTAGGGFLLLRELLALPTARLEAGLTTVILDESRAYTPPHHVEIGFSSIDVRLGGLVRWVLGTGALRSYVSADAEFSPGRARHQLRVDAELPALPAWSVGLGAGVTWDPQ